MKVIKIHILPWLPLLLVTVLWISTHFRTLEGHCLFPCIRFDLFLFKGTIQVDIGFNAEPAELDFEYDLQIVPYGDPPNLWGDAGLPPSFFDTVRGTGFYGEWYHSYAAFTFDGWLPIWFLAFICAIAPILILYSRRSRSSERA